MQSSMLRYDDYVYIHGQILQFLLTSVCFKENYSQLLCSNSNPSHKKKQNKKKIEEITFITGKKYSMIDLTKKCISFQ